MSITIEAVNAFCQNPENLALVKTYRELKEKECSLKQAMDALYKPIFEKYDFVSQHTGEKLTYEANNLYESSQEELVNEYFEECELALKDAGYEVPAGCCPHLLARTATTKHERILVDVYCQHFCGVSSAHVVGELRDRILAQFLSIDQVKL